VEALHDHDARQRLRVLDAGGEPFADVADDPLTLNLRVGLLRIHRVVEDMHVGAATEDAAFHRG